MNVNEKYLAGVRNRLDPLFRSAPTEDYDPRVDRVIVLSDHHRGIGDRADDFRRCEHAYAAALGFYRVSEYRLFLLGDVEELWEVTRPARIFDHYRAVMKLERDFTDATGLVRFWGNHDDRWSRAKSVSNELSDLIGGAPMNEALKLRIRRPGEETATVFLVHGHQGTPESDRFSALARLPVRYVWPLVQRWQGWSATTPARDHALREDHDTAMFEWAREQTSRILIAGHTHRPVFAGSRPDPPVARPVAELEAALCRGRAHGDHRSVRQAAVELEYARTLVRRPETTVTVSPPCYFNTGCCSFPDGDITGIELADNEIRLIRWPGNLAELRRNESRDIDPDQRILARANLDEILDAVAHPPARPAIHRQQLAEEL